MRRAQSRGETQAVQIERKAVAQIHGGGGADSRAKEPAEAQARLGTQMALPGLAAAGSESQRGAAQPARNIDRIARRAPLRRSAFPRGTAPATTMSQVSFSPCARSPPINGVPSRPAAAGVRDRSRPSISGPSRRRAKAKPGRTAARRPWPRYRSARAPALSSRCLRRDAYRGGNAYLPPAGRW